MLLGRQLWVRQNLAQYKEDMREKYFEELKKDKPEQYKKYQKHMRKHQ